MTSLKKHEFGFLQVNPLPTLDSLKNFYAEKYYQNSVSSTYSKEYSAEEKDFFNNKAIIASYILDKPTGSLFDVGCGEGFFPAFFHEHGWTIYGCDFSSFGIEKFNPQLLPFFKQGDIYDVLDSTIKSGQKFDLVNLSNVLEHVIDPIGMLSSLKSLLNPGGLLRICVPNDYSKFQTILVENKCTSDTWYIPPEHLNYFNSDSLRNTLEKSGFDIKKVLCGFPIEMFLLNEHSNYWADRTKGKAAHKTRVIVENHLISQNLNAYIDYCEAAGRLGFGRELTAFVS